MEVIKQFIEEHIPKMDTPEKVYQLFAGLGYKTLDLSYRGKEARGLIEKEASIWVIKNLLVCKSSCDELGQTYVQGGP
jgi:hypothetical protein